MGSGHYPVGILILMTLKGLFFKTLLLTLSLNSKADFSNPQWKSFRRSIFESTKSNAFLKSMNNRILISFLFRFTFKSEINSCNAVSHECPLQKPCWHLKRMLFIPEFPLFGTRDKYPKLFFFSIFIPRTKYTFFLFFFCFSQHMLKLTFRTGTNTPKSSNFEYNTRIFDPGAKWKKN